MSNLRERRRDHRAAREAERTFRLTFLRIYWATLSDEKKRRLRRMDRALYDAVEGLAK